MTQNYEVSLNNLRRRVLYKINDTLSQSEITISFFSLFSVFHLFISYSEYGGKKDDIYNFEKTQFEKIVSRDLFAKLQTFKY